MMIHKYSVIDVDFQVQTKYEFNDIKRVFMVISSKRGWLLTTALARRIQHTERRNGTRVTAMLLESASVGRPLFRLCQSRRPVAKTPR